MKELQHFDLLIGDIVYSSFSDIPCKVIGIQVSADGYCMVRVDNVDGWKDFSSLTPIKLSVELLEKIGFEKVPQENCHEPYYWEIRKTDDDDEDYPNILYRIRAYSTFFTGMYISIDNFCDCEPLNFNKQVESLHELQHAMRACGIEKRIEV